MSFSSLPFEITEEQLQDAVVFRRKITYPVAVEILTLYEQGVSIRELMKRFRLSNRSISTLLVRLHIPIRTHLAFCNRPRLLTQDEREEAALRVYFGEALASVVRSFGITNRGTYTKIFTEIIKTLVEDLNLKIPERYLINPVSDERVMRMYDLWNKGLSLEKISSSLGIKRDTVQYTLHRCGLKLNLGKIGKFTEDDKKRIVEEFLKGATRADLADMFHCNQKAIVWWLLVYLGYATHYDRELVMQKVDNKGFKPGPHFPGMIHTKAGAIRRQVQEWTPELAAAAREIALSLTEKTSDRLKAIEMLWDRGWGKPKEEAEEDETISPQDRIASMISPKLQQALTGPAKVINLPISQVEVEDVEDPENK